MTSSLEREYMDGIALLKMVVFGEAWGLLTRPFPPTHAVAVAEFDMARKWLAQHGHASGGPTRMASGKIAVVHVDYQDQEPQS